MAIPTASAASQARPTGPVDREPLAEAVARGADVRLAVVGSEARLERDDADPVALPIGGPVPATALRGVRTVAVGDLPATAEPWLRQLAATGTVLVRDGDAAGWDPGVAAVAGEPLPEHDDAVGWERRSVRQRRAALVAARDDGGEPWPEVSAVLCTRRPERLERAVEQLEAQRYTALEVVVVCHGAGFDHALVREATARLAVPGEVLHVDAAVSFGSALQEGSDRATGRLLTKLDDDDEYGPWHVLDLVLAHAYSGATVVGKFPSAVYLEELDQTVWRDDHPPERYDTAVAGGTLLLARDDLRAAGGWPAVPRGVDTRLLEAVTAGGGAVYRTHPLGYLLTRHSDRHTWQVDDGAFLRTSTRQWLGRYEGTLERDS